MYSKTIRWKFETGDLLQIILWLRLQVILLRIMENAGFMLYITQLTSNYDGDSYSLILFIKE